MQTSRSKIAVIVLAGLVAWQALRSPTLPPAPPPAAKPALPAPTPAKMPLLFFTQTGCPPCRVVDAALDNAAVKALVAAKFDLAEISPPDPRFEQYGVTGTPTLVVILPTGRKSHTGAMTAPQLLAWLQSVDMTRRPILPLRRSRRETPQLSGGARKSGTIQELGYNGPDGRTVQIPYPDDYWAENITSRGQGCCGFRSIDFAAHWQNVPVLWGFPEWLKQTGQPGGAWTGNVKTRITAICKARGQAEPDYINVECDDFALLKLILATGRLPVIDYIGQDGVHYPGRIAHCVCVSYCDDDYVCILDNNFPPGKSLWMTTAEFKKRWPGWIIALLAPRPPHAPHN